jgi:ABC-type antimicrobial peptide transport system permease subunit
MLVGAGVAAGGTSAFLLSGILASFLYDVTPHDAAVFAGAPLVLAAAACAAAAVPTRRALRIDPACVLRAE